MSFLTPVKKKLSFFLARTTDRGNEAGAKLFDIVTDLTSDGSTVTSPPATPHHDPDTCTVSFSPNQDKKLLSPPKEAEEKQMTMKEVNEELEIIYPDYAQLRDSDDPNENAKYCKLVYAVGKDFFEGQIEKPSKGLSKASQEEADHYHRKSVEHVQLIAKQIVNPEYGPGMRFHTLFSAYDANDRQWTLENNNGQKERIEEYEYYVHHQRLAQVADFRKYDSKNIYEVFNDEVNFPNLKPQYRVQKSGNCFAQAAILLHFYLQLVHNKQLVKEQAYMVDLSRFMRNLYHGDKLYQYVVQQKGDPYQTVLCKLLEGNYDPVEDEGNNLSFGAYVKNLKEHGPAIVKMFVGEDFKKDRTWTYEGTPPQCKDKEREGHGMLLVGVVQVGKDEDLMKGTDVFFILQNFWQDKQFMMVRRDYLRGSAKMVNGTPSIDFVVYEGNFQSANYEAIYAKTAVKDVFLSSHLLERPASANGLVKIRTFDAKGQNHTKWM